MFRVFISIFGNTSSEENKQKIDFGLGHLAVFLLYLPNLSQLLSNDEIQPSFVSRELVNQFEKKDIFFVRGSSGKVEKTLTLEALKKSGTHVVGIDIRRDIDFNPMSDKTLLHAIEFVSVVRTKLNKKQQSSVSEAVVQPMIEELKTKYARFKERGYDYFGFLYVFSALLEQFVLTNSVSKENKLILRSDFSPCCIQVPEFEIHTIDEEKRMKAVEERKKIQKQKELEVLKEEERRRIESALRLDEIRFKREQEDERIKAQEAQRKKAQEEKEAAAAAAVAAAPTELTAKDKQKLTIQRNGNFRNHVEPIFQQFSQAIQSGDYQTAADMLNTKLKSTPKLQTLYLHVPWTEANMRKFSPTVKQAYDDLLASASSAVESPPPPPSVIASSAVESPPPPPVTASSSAKKVVPSKPLSKKELAELERVRKQEEFEIRRQADTDKKAARIQEAASKRKDAAVSRIASIFQMTKPRKDFKAAQKAAEEYAAFKKFEMDINEFGREYFELMFRCDMMQFFRIANVIHETSDDDILRILFELNPVPDSAVTVSAHPLREYMEQRGETSRAFLVFGLLNGLCRPENVRIIFVGRTFLQLLACHSRLPQDKCRELHITQETSDFDAHVIFNNDRDPMQCRSFFMFIFNLFWNIPKTNFHIHFERNDAQWLAFNSLRGHIYESATAGSPETIKVSLNNGKITEISDVTFTTLAKFGEKFAIPSGAQLLHLKYKLDHQLQFFANQRDAFDVNLDFEFPNEQSGLYESLHIIIKTLNSFLTNKFNFRDRQAESYFYHISTLLKFIIRAIQFKGISLFNGMKYLSIRLIYRGITERDLDEILDTNFHIAEAKAAADAVTSAKVKVVAMNAARDAARAAAAKDVEQANAAAAKDVEQANAAAYRASDDAAKAELASRYAAEKVTINQKVKLAAIALINLFFNEDKTNFSEQTFTETNIYRKTNKKAADDRVEMMLHKKILEILIQYGFEKYYFEALQAQVRTNFFGGVKHSIRNIRNNQHQRQYTKKNKKQKLRKTKSNKNKKIKFTLSKKKMKTSFKINKK
jgi:hypothetical protein